MIWINFKIYRETFGDGAVRLAEVCRRVAKKTGVPIVPVVSALDFWRVKEAVGGEIWMQHLDAYFEGAKTGWQSPLAAASLGVAGVILNHAEHQLPPGQIRQFLASSRRPAWQKKWQRQLGKRLAKNLEKLKVMVCFRTKGQARRWLGRLDPRPDWFAYEPWELIGGSVPVTKANAAAIRHIREILPKSVPLAVGAGIKTAADVRRARQLGAAGVVVSSAVIKAKDPERALFNLVKGWQ